MNKIWHCSILICLLLSVLYIESNALNTDPKPSLKFIENKNQWPERIDFSLQIPGGQMFIEAGKFTYSLIDQAKLEEIHERQHHIINESDLTFDKRIKSHVLQVNFIGANLNSIPQPFDKLPTYYNYFIGSDSMRWASNANSFSGVLYSNLYPGIDIKLYSANENLKYDYILKEQADASRIKVIYEGAENFYLDNGNLYIETSLGNLIEKKPYAFQFINGEQKEVRCNYVLNGKIISFDFPDGYDPCYELVIDPLLIFSTYSGSTADNWGSTATYGEHGTLYSAGVTTQIPNGKFPSTPGAFQTSYGGQFDIGILKYDSTGQNLLYATYLGGFESESAHSLIMNSNEELIVLGTTSSINFPTTSGSIDRNFNGGDSVTNVVTYTNGSDLFVARISKNGNVLLASTYLGGSSNDGINPIAGGLVKNYGDELRGDVNNDDEGNIYISAVTSSTDFPVTHGFDTLYNGGNTDAIVMKLNSNLSKIIWANYIGGKGADAAHTLKLDNNKNVYVAGGTNSNNFPVTLACYQKLLAGKEDGWIAHLQNDGKKILSATYTGTDQFDQVYFLDLNKSGEVYVYGQTSGNFPISTGVYRDAGSGQFLQKFNSAISVSIFSTVFGSGAGIPNISPTAFLVSDCNNIYMSGWGGEINSASGFWRSNTVGMRVTEDSYQKTTSGSDFYFIVLSDDAKEFLYATYLGGTQSRTHVDGGTSRFDKSGIVYHAVCSGCRSLNAARRATSDFPTTSNAWSRTNRSGNCNNAAFKFDLSVLRARIQTNTIALDMPGFNKLCIPDKIVFQNKSIGGKKFDWDLDDGTLISKTDTSAITHEYKNTGKYTVKLKAIDESTCVGEDMTSTVVNVYKPKTKIQDDDTFCFGPPYPLTTFGPALFDWTTDNESFKSRDTENIHYVNPEDTTRYFVTIYEDEGCVRKDTVQLNVIPKIDVDFKLTRISDCFTRPKIQVSNLTALNSSDNAFFDFGDGEISDATDIEHLYLNDSTYHVKLVASREFCVFEKSIDVASYLIKVPNVITPERIDGNNDYFTIQYGEKNKGLTPADFGIKTSLEVYDRWGRPVYEAEDYQYNWAADGLAAGVYYFKVTVEGYATCKSWLHVIK